MLKLVTVSVVVISWLFIGGLITYAYADLGIPSILPDNPLYGFKLFIEDVKETFALSDQEKAELKTIHAVERTRESEALAELNREIPLSVQENYVKKMNEIGEIIISPRSNDDDLSFFEKLKVSYTILVNQDELNQIRYFLSDFREMQRMDYDDKIWRSQELDNKINRMYIVKQACPEPIQILELSEASHPYKALQKKCPALKGLPLDDAINILNGGVI